MKSQNNFEKIEKKVLSELYKHANKKIAEKNLYFHKYKNISTLGISAPVLRDIIKKHKQEFNGLSVEEKLNFSNHLFTKNNEELGHIAIHLINTATNQIKKEDLTYIENYTEYLNSWSLTDDYGINVIQPLLLKYKNQVLSLIINWSKSENIWKRRLSMIAFVRKIGKSGLFIDDLLSISDNLIWDNEDLVRKAVGWALKDNMKANKPKIIEYVKTLRNKGVSSTIILYAIRDIKEKQERESILN